MSTRTRCILVIMLAGVLISTTSAQVPAQCVVNSGGSPGTPVTAGTFHAIVIYCVNVGEDSLIPPQLLNVGQYVSDYFQRATFGNFSVQIAGVLRKDATHAFVSRVPYNWADFIVQADFATDILQQADDLYDFSQFDFDGDGFVDFVIFTFLNYSSRGTVGLPNEAIFTTNDPDPRHPGEFIKIDGRGYMTGSSRAISQRKDLRDLVNGVYDYIGIWFHELGHSLFNFPDMNHGGFTSYDHYSIGGFDAMAGGGFQGRQSLYNPWFCEQRGWGSFTTLTSNTLSAPLSDFYSGGTAYRFTPPLPAFAAPNQKFLVTYHQKIVDNQWTYNWPVDASQGGLLIWHVA
jgi:M6 family metalloprotease-like protein